MKKTIKRFIYFNIFLSLLSVHNIEENYILSLEKGFFFERLEILLDRLIENNDL